MFAVNNQYFGGPDYSYNRMSWIKSNFLWMMYRCGWASKEGQEHVLAITIPKSLLRDILQESAISSFNSLYHSSHDEWKEELDKSEVRLQWDPDHDPYGQKIERRAIQLGLKGGMLKRFARDEVMSIEDITPFVKEQKMILYREGPEKLEVPLETVFEIEDFVLRKRIGVTPSDQATSVVSIQNPIQPMDNIQ